MNEQYAHLLAKFEESETSPWEVLVVPPDEIAQRVRISRREIEVFRADYAAAAAVSPLSYIPDAPISTQERQLDELLGGGLRRGNITEVCGPAGMGKTCFCCQMALCAETAVYIASEDSVRVVQRRMQQLTPRYGSMANVRFVQVRSAAELRMASYKIRHFAPAPDVVVLDSVAALFEIGNSSLQARELEDTLGLRRLAAEAGCAVIVANQVRDRVVPDDHVAGPLYEYDQQQVSIEGDWRLRPALGPAWAARIDTRLFLRPNGQERDLRELLLVFSKWAPYAAFPLQMTAQGLRVLAHDSAEPA